jgi:hypothetical protein
MRGPLTSALAVASVAAGLPALAGITVYKNEKGDKKVEIGARIQVEYVGIEPRCDAGVACLEDDGGDTFDSYDDDLFFRRLRPYIAGTITEDWMGKVEVDFGESLDADEVQVKDAYFEYSGFDNEHSKLFIGNSKTVFAREFLTTSAKLVLVERGFTGDHNVGVPDRALGVRWDTGVLDDKISYQLHGGVGSHDPAVNRMDFDSPVSNQGDWNEGLVASGRIDFHPLGHVDFSQGDFDKKDRSKIVFGLGAFGWWNDGDNDTYTDAGGNATSLTKVDLDEALGYELSFGYRGHGVTIDAEYQRVSGDTVDEDFTGGIYRDGSTDLDKVSIVGSYMILQSFFEIVLGYDQQDASNYEDVYRRTTAGLNWYFNQHNLKLQLDYRRTENFIGLQGQDQDVVFVSTQFVF